MLGIVMAALLWAVSAWGEERLSREAFVAEVLASHPSLRALEAEERAARARGAAVGALPPPMVRVGVAPWSVVHAEMPVGASIALRQAVPGPRRTAAGAGVWEAQAEGSRAEREAVAAALIEEAELLWTGWWSVREALALAATHDLLLAELEPAAEAAFAAGRGSAAGPLSVAWERARLAEDVLAWTAEEAALRGRLLALAGRPPGSDLGVPEPLAPPPTPGEARPRPEQRAAEARVDAAADAIALAAAARRPEVAVMASYSSMWMDPHHRPMIEVEASLPWFAEGARAELVAAQTEAEGARARLSATELDLRGELAAAEARLEGAAARYALVEDRLIPLSRERLDAARAGWVAGLEPLSLVLEAERALRDVELRRVEALAAWTDAHTAWRRAAGSTGVTP